jgi:hypothetical protein
LFAGLGSSISCKHPLQASLPIPTAQVKKDAVPQKPARLDSSSTNPNPFDRYLQDAKANWPEPAEIQVAEECQIDLGSALVRYAQEPGEKWLPVKDLTGALKDQDTDFYHTVAVWHAGDHLLVELWGMELDTGDYFRVFYCLDKRRITLVDSVSWQVEMHNESSQDTGWGYEQKWKLGQGRDLVTTSKQFVDLREHPITEPILDAETKKGLEEETIGVRTWAELELPDSLLQ